MSMTGIYACSREPSRAGGERGVTLIELVVFIIVVGILVSGLMGGFATITRNSATPVEMTQASQIGQERMELIRARKDVVGFACFTGTRYDPCQSAAAAGSCPAFAASTHPACNNPPMPGYTVTTALDETGACMGSDPNYKCITVTVTAPSGTQSELQAAVANY